MSYKIIFSALALKEFENSFYWYEEQEVGLGKRFIEVIDNMLDTLSANPESYPQKKSPYRGIVTGKFPYLIIYEILKDKNIINILHVFHTSRNPKHKYRRR